MKKYKKQFTSFLKFALAWSIGAIFIVWILQWNVFQNINNLFFDPLTTSESRKDVVIIGIDEKSLTRFGAWPWNRDSYGALLNQLKDYSPRAIGFDIVFAESRAGDDIFREELRSTTIPVIFASKLERNEYISSLFAHESSTTYEGVVNVFPDTDAKVRALQHWFLINGVCIPSFSQKLIETSLKRPGVVTDSCNTSPYLFRYQKETIKVSFVDVVDGVVPRDSLRDKIVLVGFATTDLETDSFFGLFGTKINGVEIHASDIAHVLNSASLEITPLRNVLILSFILAIILGAIPFAIRKFSRQIIFLVVIVASVIIGAIVGYEFGYKTYIPWMLGFPLFSYFFCLIYSYITHLRKNEYLKKLFGTYVHPSLLEELIQNPKKLALGGEKRRMTVLFSDVRGFTSFSEKLSPEALVDLLNNYLNTMSPLILNSKGTIDKYIGDAIMAFWNAPLEIKNHELLAVQTALTMQEKLEEFNVSLNRKDDLKLDIGIGINTGDMVVGNMGSDERFNYTVMGDAVNTGSRFEGLTKKYGVMTIVGESTRNAINDEAIIFRRLDIMSVKGKSELTTIYEPLKSTPTVKQFIATYEAGFNAYTSGDFDEAKTKLTPLADNGDKPSKILLERMKIIDLSIWKGVWKWEEK